MNFTRVCVFVYFFLRAILQTPTVKYSINSTIVNKLAPSSNPSSPPKLATSSSKVKLGTCSVLVYCKLLK